MAWLSVTWCGSRWPAWDTTRKALDQRDECGFKPLSDMACNRLRRGMAVVRPFTAYWYSCRRSMMVGVYHQYRLMVGYAYAGNWGTFCQTP